jgi:hypothetical protein
MRNAAITRRLDALHALLNRTTGSVIRFFLPDAEYRAACGGAIPHRDATSETWPESEMRADKTRSRQYVRRDPNHDGL